MRYVCRAMGIAVLSMIATGLAQGNGLSITNYQFVSEQRWSRTHSYITYRADLVNKGAAREAVTATVSSLTPSIEIVPGQTNLRFAPVPAGGVVTSVNTFTILVDRSVPFDANKLQWSFLTPWAVAGPSQTAKIGDTIVLNGSQSSNPSGAGTLSYRWSFQSRPFGTSARLIGADTVTASFVVDVAGEYVLLLTVSNGFGTDSATVVVSTMNSPPVANAGANTTVGLGSTVVLNGAGSSDVDGNPLTYLWTFLSRPAESIAILSGASTVSPSFVADRAGTYIVQLVVNDGKVNSAPATVQVSTANTPPVANAGPNQAVAVGAVVQLNGSASTDVDGDHLTYRWSFNSVPTGSTAVFSNPAAINPTFVANAPGTYVAQLIVNDGTRDSAPATVTITTNAVQAPAANAGVNQTVKHGDLVMLTGTGTDPQGLPLTFHWSMTSRPSASSAVLSSTTAPRPTFTADFPGQYIVQLIVNNGYLNSAASTVTITTTNTAPVANAGTDQTVRPGDTVNLTGAGSTDADGDTLTYAWSLIARPTGSVAALVNPAASTPSFVADVAGTYVAQLIVNDGFTNSQPATVTITAGVRAITLSPNPLTVARGSFATLTVTLGSAAGPGGVEVRLASSEPGVLSVPATLVIGQGQASASVTVTAGTAGTALILATSNGFAPASVTANVVVPSISVALDSSTIGVTSTTNATITLSMPAPVGGVVVGLSAMPAGVVNVPPTITIPSGSSGSFTVTGVGTGSATITASIPGYTSGSTSVSVSNLGAIRLASDVVVGPGQTAPFSVSLLTAAPPGGVHISLTSSAPGIATTPDSVFIPQGATTPQQPVQVSGVAFGSTVITASAPGFQGDSQTVRVTATLAFTVGSLTVGAGGNGNLTLNLSAPAPAGLIINLRSDHPSIASVPASVTFATGSTSVMVPVSGVAAGNTIIRASSPPHLAEVTAAITVAVLGNIVLPANGSVAIGQSAPFPISLSAPAPAGGTTITLTSSDTGRLTIAPATVTVDAGRTAPAVPPQISGHAPGSVSITATAPAYGSATATVSVTGALAFSPQNITVQVGGAQNVSVTIPTPSSVPITVTLVSDNTSVATVPSSVTIPANAVGASVSVTGVATGSTRIRASATGWTSAEAPVTVQTAGVITLPSNVSVPLGATTVFAVTLSQPASSPLTINLTSSDSAKVSISPSTVTIAAGQTAPATQPEVRGVSIGSANLTASATGYTPATQSVRTTATLSFVPATLTITGLTTQNATLRLSAVTPTPLTISLGSDASTIARVPASVIIPANSDSATVQVTGVALGSAVIHAGLPPDIPDATLSVTVASAGTIGLPSGTSVSLAATASFAVTLPAPASVDVVITLSSSDASKVTLAQTTLTVPAGATTPASQAQVTGVSIGAANITASAPGYTSATASVNVTASLSFSPQNVTVARGGSQNLTVNLSAATPAPVTLSLSSENTAIATVPASATIPANASGVTIAVTGVAAGSTTVHASGPSGVTGATASVHVGGDIILPGEVAVAPGEQASMPIRLSVAATETLFVQLVTSDASKASLHQSVVTIQAGQTQPESAPRVNGVDFGTATITASATGYAPATTTVTVGAALSFASPSITLPPSTNQSLGLTLSAPAPSGGLAVTLTSSDTNVATVPGSVTIPAGQSSILLQLRAVNLGAATITASTGIPTITDASLAVTVASPGSIVIPASASVAMGESVAYPVSLSSPAGQNGVTVTLNANSAHISFVPLVCTGTPCPPVPPNATQTTVFIPAGQTAPASQPQMRGVSPGPVAIAASAPGYATVNGSIQVTASFAFSPPALTIAPGSTGMLSLVLSGPAPPPPTGLTVTLTSSNSGVATVQSTVTAFWDASSPTTLNIPVTGVAAGSATIRASSPHMADATATVNVSGPVSIQTTSLPDGIVSHAYNATLTASGGNGSYTWSATGLPAGLTLAPSGTIGGAPTTAGTSSVTVTVSDQTSPTPLSATATLSITIREGIAITTSTLPAAVAESPYAAPLAASGGTPPYRWAATGLPSGLTLNPSAGTISGTPASAGTSSITISVTDSTQEEATTTLSLIVRPALRILTTSLPGGAVNVAYNATLSATGGTSPYTWSAAGLPGGLTLNPSTGLISGTPGGATTAEVMVTVTDSTAPSPVTRTASLTITIVGELSITTTSLPTGIVGVPFGAPLTATGGNTPYHWTATGLPAGLSVNPSTGAITGTPETAGSGSVSITVTDSTAPTHLTATASLTITVSAGLEISTTVLPPAAAGTPYNFPLAATGGLPPYTWAVPGMPSGLTLNTSTGVISGTPASSGTSTISITVTDATSPSHLTASRNLSLAIAPGLVITTASLPSGSVGTPYTANLLATGGNAPHTWAATGLPQGLSLNPATGVIAGTPATAGTSNVTLTLTDSTPGTPATATRSLSLVIVPALTITTSALPGGVANLAYAAVLRASGGTTPYTWAVNGLPAGLALNPSTGEISGTPTAAASATLTITVTDSTSPALTATSQLPLNIEPPLTISTSSLPSGSVNAPYSGPLAATGGTPPYHWSATGLPGGLALNASTGEITGRPTSAGTSTLGVSVTDSSVPTQATAARNVSLIIGPAVPATIAPTFGSGQSAVVLTPFTSQLQVLVRDASGAAVAGASVTFAAPSSGASLTFNTGGASAVIATNASGLATSPIAVANGTAGSYVVTATVAGVPAVTFAMTNTAAPPVGLSATNISVGQNLQSTMVVTLPAVAGPGGVQLSISSGDPARVLLGGNGRSSIQVSIPEGQREVTFLVHALAGSGTVNVTASASGLTDGVGVVTLTPSGFVLAGPNDVGASFQTFEGVSTPVTVFAARLDATNRYAEKQSLRATFGNTVTLSLSSTSAGSVSPSSVIFAPGDASVQATFRGLDDGLATVTAGVPAGFAAPSDGSNTLHATVLPGGLIMPSGLTVGRNLQIPTAITLNGVAPSGGLLMTVTSNDPGRLLLSTTPTGAGSASITLNLPPNARGTPDFYVQGFSNSGTATFTAQTSTFGSGTATLALAPSGIVFTNTYGGVPNPILAASGGSPVPVSVYSAILNASGAWVQTQALAGGLSATVTVSNLTNPSVGSVNPGQITIQGGSSVAVTQFQPGTDGMTSLSVSVPSTPAGFNAPSSQYSSLPVTVTTSRIVLSTDSEIGKDLQTLGTLILTQPAPAGGLVVTLTSNSSQLWLAPSATVAGQNSIQITVPAGSTSAIYYVQALGNSGPATYRAAATGYQEGTTTVNLTPSGVVLSSAFDTPFLTLPPGTDTATVVVSMAQLDAVENKYVARQQLRGGFSLQVTLRSENAGIGTIDSPVTINGGADPLATTTTVRRVGTGTTFVTAVQPPGFVAATNLIFEFRPMPSIQLRID